MLKSIAKTIINIIIVFIMAYTYMYFSEKLHISKEPFFKLIAITFIFGNAIIIVLKIFFENNNMDIDMD
ncbi:MAG: hypothetical protein RSC84_05065 [Peptostreptococcaceae bacterium]